jgi:hypothetical protein
MPSLEELMKMAANVQAEVEKAQGQLDGIEVAGQSGGGLVRITATAKGRVVKLDIDPSLLTADSKEMTEDLIVAAFNDARAKADQAASQAMQQMTAGLPLPPGFRL